MKAHHIQVAHLQTFVVVASTGSVTKAARHLRYAPSTVSTHVSKLERWLGIRLLRREDGKFVPTKKGKQIVRIASGVFDQLEDLEAIERDE